MSLFFADIKDALTNHDTVPPETLHGEIVHAFENTKIVH